MRLADTLAENMVWLRRSKQLSQRALARAAGLGPTTVYEIEHLRTRNPNLDTLERLARVLGVDVSELLRRPDR